MRNTLIKEEGIKQLYIPVPSNIFGRIEKLDPYITPMLSDTSVTLSTATTNLDTMNMFISETELGIFITHLLMADQSYCRIFKDDILQSPYTRLLHERRVNLSKDVVLITPDVVRPSIQIGRVTYIKIPDNVVVQDTQAYAGMILNIDSEHINDEHVSVLAKAFMRG